METDGNQVCWCLVKYAKIIQGGHGCAPSWRWLLPLPVPRCESAAWNQRKRSYKTCLRIEPLTIDNFNSTMSSLFPHPAWISKTSGCWITECLACWWNVLRSCSALWSLVLRGPTDKKGMLLTPWNLNMLNSIYVSRQCIDVSRWKQSFREWVGRVFPFFPKLVKFTSTHACTDFVSQTLHLSVDSDLSRWRRRLGFFCEILRVKSLEPEFSRSVELKALWPSVTAPLGPLTLSALAGSSEVAKRQLSLVLPSIACACKTFRGPLVFLGGSQCFMMKSYDSISSATSFISIAFIIAFIWGLWALRALLADSLCWVHGGRFQVALSPPTSCLRSRC